MQRLIIFALIALSFTACASKEDPKGQVWLTSEAGDKYTQKEDIVFHKVGSADEYAAFVVHPEDRRQTIDGFGGSLTESSAFVLGLPRSRKASSNPRRIVRREGR